MDREGKAGDALKVFCREFGIPDNLTFDGSKEQGGKNTEFMKQINKHNIDYHVAELDHHKQNSAEGKIHEVRRKWYMIIVHK